MYSSSNGTNFFCFLFFNLLVQCIPRQVWLDFNGRQLVQWPIQEVESLRQYKVQFQNRVLANGDLFEVKKITAAEVSVPTLLFFCFREYKCI